MYLFRHSTVTALLVNPVSGGRVISGSADGTVFDTDFSPCMGSFESTRIASSETVSESAHPLSNQNTTNMLNEHAKITSFDLHKDSMSMLVSTTIGGLWTKNFSRYS